MGAVAPDDPAREPAAGEPAARPGDDIDRLVARLDAAVRATAGAVDGNEPVTVEMIVEAGAQSRSWYVHLDEHGGGAAFGPAPDPTLVVRIDGPTFASLRSGALDVQRAIDAGRLTVRGDLGALARARPALRALAGALAVTERASSED